MPTNQNRLDRIDEMIMREISMLLREVKDPRISGKMISVLRCETTNDLRWCRVFVSVLGDFDERELEKGLKSCGGFLRSELAKRLSLRYTPELKFIIDKSIEKGAQISKMIDDLNK